MDTELHTAGTEKTVSCGKTFQEKTESTGFEIRIPRSFVDHAAEELSSSAFKLYMLLEGWRNVGTGECFPSHATLARKMRCTGRQIRNLLGELCNSGFIQVKKQTGRVSVYVLPRNHAVQDENPGTERERIPKNRRISQNIADEKAEQEPRKSIAQPRKPISYYQIPVLTNPNESINHEPDELSECAYGDEIKTLCQIGIRKPRAISLVRNFSFCDVSEYVRRLKAYLDSRRQDPTLRNPAGAAVSAMSNPEDWIQSLPPDAETERKKETELAAKREECKRAEDERRRREEILQREQIIAKWKARLESGEKTPNQVPYSILVAIHAAEKLSDNTAVQENKTSWERLTTGILPEKTGARRPARREVRRSARREADKYTMRISQVVAYSSRMADFDAH